MPLPAALANRLKKRGLLREEEEAAEEEQSEGGCPNVSNRYHKCTDYCLKRWGLKKTKNGLPGSWLKVITDDRSYGFVYFWDPVNQLVSWLPPTDPEYEAVPCLGASTLTVEPEISAVRGNTAAAPPERHVSFMEPEPPAGEQKDTRVTIRQERQRSTNRFSPYPKGGRRAKEDEVDPMDPSSYSDTPRGNWSTGLPSQGEAKTGVDSTASGPLFQQRPYPSPGAILKLNKEPTGPIKPS